MAESTNRRSPGWYVGVGVFWLIAAWLVTVGLSSIIPQIFPRSPKRPAAPVASCTRALLDREEALLARTAKALTAPGSDRTALQAWLADWDGQMAGLEPACAQNEAKAEAHAELLRLRHALHDMLRKLDREQGPRLRHIHTLLGSRTSASGVQKE